MKKQIPRRVAPRNDNIRTRAALSGDAMRTILRVSFVGFAVFAVGALQAKAQTTPTPATTAATDSGRKPVVVELFTSEGCSDCPPAEALALKLEQQLIAGADVIVLEEHVDYWNHQGWVDPYSSMEWTARQRVYVAKINDNPYSPEMVVDGQSQFVGSNGRAALAAIEKAARGPETSVTVAAKNPGSGDSQDFTVSVGKPAGDTNGDTAEVWLAVVEDGLHSSVSAGENAGHVLYHAAVVRSLKKIGDAKGNGDAAFAGDARVKFKSGWKRENLRVVVFVQEKKSREILGAASMKTTK